MRNSIVFSLKNNINFKRDLDTSWVREFIETKKIKMNDVSFADSNASIILSGNSEMDKKTKALYLWIKKQLNQKTHPINAINKEFERVFSMCYKVFVNRAKSPSKKLLQRLNNINNKMKLAQSEYDLPSPRIIETKDDEPESELAPSFRDKPNYLITNQVVGDIKIFIKVLLSAVISFYEPVIKQNELNLMKEDLVETITNLVLSNDVYKIMFSFFRLEFAKLEENLKDRYREFKNITPGEWRVNEYFRMDHTSPILKIYQDIVQREKKSLFSEPMSINFESPNRLSKTGQEKKKKIHSYANTFILEDRHNHIEEEDHEEDNNEEEEKEPKFVYIEKYNESSHIVESKNGSLPYAIKHRRSKSDELDHKRSAGFNISKLPKFWEIEKRIQAKPFHDAILKLREIDKSEGPMMKLRLLEKVNDMIKEGIYKFWEGLPINESHLTITQDIKIPLYIYMVIKCKMVNLAAHIRFIQEFTTNYVHENNLGCNLALYESAMTIVADKERNTLLNVIDQNKIFEKTVRYNESFASTVFMDDLDPFVEFTPSTSTVHQ